jgi:hypothetical protein
VRIDFTFGVGQDKEGLAIDRDQQQRAIREIKTEAAKLFGGYTLYQAQGGWINGGGRLVEEDSMTLTVYITDEILGYSRQNDVAQLSSTIKEQLNQESILVSEMQCSHTIQ